MVIENDDIISDLKRIFQTTITDPIAEYIVGGTEFNSDVLGKDYFYVCRKLNSKTHQYIRDTFGIEVTVIEFSKNNIDFDNRKHESLVDVENLQTWCEMLYSDSSLNESQELIKVLDRLIDRGYTAYGCEVTMLDDHKEVDFKLIYNKELYTLNVTIHTK